jgi:nucleoside diphosphate kinase
MAKELAYVLINPYSVAKSRTGGIMARYLSRSGLELVGAGMYGPSAELATGYAQMLRDDSGIDPEYANTLADYVLRSYMPEADSGKRKRVMLLLFEGEDAISKVLSVTGPLRKNMEAGETIRDTFGDYIVDPDGKVIYVEPAVLCGQDQAGTAAALKLWASYESSDSGVILNAGDTHPGDDRQQTLVIIKPDNFRFPSVRPGNIIDMFSRSGLRIVGAKLHRMSCAEGEEFYGPVRAVLREKLKDKVVNEICAAASERLDLELPQDVKQQVGDLLGPIFGDRQFGDIVQFMTGCRPESTPAEKKSEPGSERCLALVYSGANAVDTIRSILGPTDPSKAGTGTVRRELGQNIMVNAAHASDSVENAQREMKIIDFSAPSIARLVEKYYA